MVLFKHDFTRFQSIYYSLGVYTEMKAEDVKRTIKTVVEKA